jgi:TRAP-type C4-dicarboxylate transport system permease small subunit
LYHYYFVSYSIFNILFFLILFNILFIFLNQSVFNYYNDLIRYNFVYLLFIGYSIFILFP